MTIHHYQTDGGKNLIHAYLNKISMDEKVDGFAVLEKLEQEKFDELTIKVWRGKISEVYFYKHNRMFYVIVDGEDLYVLHACRKQKNKTEKTDGDIVTKRARRLGDELSQKFI